MQCDQSAPLPRGVALISLFNYDNYGLRLLHADLERHGIPVNFIGFKRLTHKETKTLKNDLTEAYDCQSEVRPDDLEVLLSELKRLRPLLIGISLQSAHVHLARRITALIREHLEAPILWGGAHPTIDPEGSLEHADMVCIGEGFAALRDLAHRLITGQPYHDIANLWIRHNGTIIRNPPGPSLEDLDSLPFPSHSPGGKIYIDEGRIQGDKSIDYIGFGLLEDPFRTIHQTMTALGCPMQCSYCIHGLKVEKYRRRSVEAVIRELSEVKHRNPYLKMIMFWDNIFHIDKAWCLEFAKAYKAEIDIPFYAYTHPLFTDREVFTALRHAGWIFTIMGVQSGCMHTRNALYHRRETNAQIIEAARLLGSMHAIRDVKKPFFKIYYDFIINNPLEDETAFRESLDLILAFPKGFVLNAFNLTFFPNYPITKDFLARGLIRSDDVEGSSANAKSMDWIVTFDKHNADGPMRLHKYYYLLFSLAQFKLFPNQAIRLIAQKRWFYGHMTRLYNLCRVVRVIDLALWPENYKWAWEILNLLPIPLKIRRRTLVRFT